MEELAEFYKGFYLKGPFGNNAFSLTKRINKKIYVPPVINGTPDDLKLSEKISFSEVVNGVECNFKGLRNFIHWKYKDTHCFIFDNHNHAFFFWSWAFNKELIESGETLVHVDQHSDMRNPQKFISLVDFSDLEKVFLYTNYHLNVGNFIRPALKMGIFKINEIIDSSVTFKKVFRQRIVLDLDMDIFSTDMDYLDKRIKINKIREYVYQAKFITIATSPFFMDQNIAIERLKEIF